MEILLAIILGTLFGFTLNRIGATNPSLIINMLRLKDLHLMKVILFAIGLSSTLLFLGIELGVINSAHLSIKTAYIGVIVGGMILGAGFAIAGYCPGTGLAAAATGRKDGWFFVLGGLLGAFTYMLNYAYIKDTFLMNKIAGGKATIAKVGVGVEVGQYQATLTENSGIFAAIAIGVILMAIAYKLPKKIL